MTTPFYVCVSGTLIKASPCVDGCGAMVFAAAALRAPKDGSVTFDVEPCVATHEMVAGHDVVFSRPRTVYRRHMCTEEPKP